MDVNRRAVLKGIGVAGATLSFAGLASASDGRARYVVGATGKSVADRVEAAGFEVLNALAGGDVLLVAGPEDAVDDLASINGVSTALPDFEVEFEEPTIEVSTVEEQSLTVDEVYDQLLWDKQVQQVREAHEYATGSGRTIAVLDTGVDDTHPDLDVDVDASVSIVDGQPAEHVGDSGDHGTHVAGTAAGTGEVGMIGTAPDATVVSVRILGPDTGTWGDILGGLAYAAAIGADAANMSIGTVPIPPEGNADGYRRLLEPVAQTVTAAGTLLVGSAGNSDANLQQGGTFTMPNSLAGVLSISATAPNDERAFYSNYGTDEIGVGAPGGAYEGLVKTYCGYAEWILAGEPMPADDPREPGTETEVCFDENGSVVVDAEEATVCYPCTMPEWPYPFHLVYSSLPAGGYGLKAGTSMAAPQVTGLAALVRELAPEASARQVASAIQHGAEGTDGRSDAELGAGRTNALKTVERLS